MDSIDLKTVQGQITNSVVKNLDNEIIKVKNDLSNVVNGAIEKYLGNSYYHKDKINIQLSSIESRCFADDNGYKSISFENLTNLIGQSIFELLIDKQLQEKAFEVLQYSKKIEALEKKITQLTEGTK